MSLVLSDVSILIVHDFSYCKGVFFVKDFSQETPELFADMSDCINPDAIKIVLVDYVSGDPLKQGFPNPLVLCIQIR